MIERLNKGANCSKLRHKPPLSAELYDIQAGFYVEFGQK